MLMAVLIACISSEKGTFAHVAKVMSGESWDKIILVTSENPSAFQLPKPAEFVQINPAKNLQEIAQDIKSAIGERLKSEIDVAVNFISGSGKEHMALLSALLKLGVGIRLIALTKEGVKEI